MLHLDTMLEERNPGTTGTSCLPSFARRVVSTLA